MAEYYVLATVVCLASYTYGLMALIVARRCLSSLFYNKDFTTHWQHTFLEWNLPTVLFGTVLPRLLRPLKYKCFSNRGSVERC